MQTLTDCGRLCWARPSSDGTHGARPRAAGWFVEQQQQQQQQQPAQRQPQQQQPEQLEQQQRVPLRLHLARSPRIPKDYRNFVHHGARKRVRGESMRFAPRSSGDPGTNIQPPGGDW